MHSRNLHHNHGHNLDHDGGRDRRPLGPRAPSPLPPPSLYDADGPPSPSPSTSATELERALETTLVNLSQIEFPHTPTPTRAGHFYSQQQQLEQSRNTSTPSQLPRSGRLPFVPNGNGNTDTTPRGVAPVATNGDALSTIVPLSIKKKTSNATPSAGRRTYSKNSPLSRTSVRTVTTRAAPELERSESVSSAKSGADDGTTVDSDSDHLRRLAETTREDVSRVYECSSITASTDLIPSLTSPPCQLFAARRALKKIKLEVNSLASKLPATSSPSPTKCEPDIRSPIALRALTRTPQQQNAVRLIYFLFLSHIRTKWTHQK